MEVSALPANYERFNSDPNFPYSFWLPTAVPMRQGRGGTGLGTPVAWRHALTTNLLAGQQILPVPTFSSLEAVV